MKKTADPPKNGWQRVQDALDYGGALYDKDADFDAACDHVAQLLEDAARVYTGKSYGTAAFLAITALEETAKAHVGIFRRANPNAQKGRDPFRDHAAKHAMALLDTVFMGQRLSEAIGFDACARLQEEAPGGFTTIREDGLYVGRKEGHFATPKSLVDKTRARELVLLAIEAADDALPGYSNHSMDVGKQFEALFATVAAF